MNGNVTSSWEDQLQERAKKKAAAKVAAMLQNESQLQNTGNIRVKIQQQSKGKQVRITNWIWI